MPRVDELIKRLGPARYISTLDLTRGYWQVPVTPRSLREDSILDPRWTLPLLGSHVRRTWGASHIPAPHGSGTPTPPTLCHRLYWWHYHSQPKLAVPLGAGGSSARGAAECGPKCQPGEVPAGAGGKKLPGTHLGARPSEAATNQTRQHPDVALPHHQETGEDLPGTGRLLPPVHTWLGHDRRGPPRGHWEETAQPGPVEWRHGDGLPWHSKRPCARSPSSRPRTSVSSSSCRPKPPSVRISVCILCLSLLLVVIYMVFT